MRSFYETKINCNRSLLQFSLLQRSHLLFYRFLSVAFLLILTISLRQKTAVNVTDHLYTIVCRYCKFKIKSKVSYSHKKTPLCRHVFANAFYVGIFILIFTKKFVQKDFLYRKKNGSCRKKRCPHLQTPFNSYIHLFSAKSVYSPKDSLE